MKVRSRLWPLAEPPEHFEFLLSASAASKAEPRRAALFIKRPDELGFVVPASTSWVVVAGGESVDRGVKLMIHAPPQVVLTGPTTDRSLSDRLIDNTNQPF